ncbi:hypothetical protein [Stenotrophomonas maltophilia]|uniref:hypothetical protein n=1 Tax=Stenotrophomonas maltophilia TaxID=40324 RepID=UPI0015DDAF77|nr:hypothetical protein [Stenotrophomonas maltophilia]MBA0286846.1 hypothetical protein [Stenotrophomonas maltophilia]
MSIVRYLKSLFGGEPAKALHPVESKPSYKAFEIQPSQDVFDCYPVVFEQVMSTVVGIPAEVLEEAKRFIMSGEGGFLNAHRYYDHVWTHYFADHEWRWLEHEDWVQIFTEFGRFPTTFPKPESFEQPSARTLLNRLKVPELKRLCQQSGVTFSSKTNKPQLLELLGCVPGIEQHPQLRAMREQAPSDARRPLYTSLMRTIQFRAMSLHNKRKAQNVGVTRFEIVHALEQDREFVELALRRQPDGLSPLYPGDLSGVRAVIDVFDG